MRGNDNDVTRAAAAGVAALALVVGLASMPAAALGQGDGTYSASSEVTLRVVWEGPEPTEALAPSFARKGDTWIRVVWDHGMEWELLRLTAGGGEEVVEGRQWNDGQTSEFRDLEGGVTYVVRARLKSDPTKVAQELRVVTFREATPPEVASTGVELAAASDGGASVVQAVGSAWLRLTDESDLGEQDALSEHGRVLEYTIDGGSTWQTDTLFDGLTPGATYAIRARVVGGTKVSDPTYVVMPQVSDAGNGSADNGGGNAGDDAGNDAANTGDATNPGEAQNDSTANNLHVSVQPGTSPTSTTGGSATSTAATRPGPLAQTGDLAINAYHLALIALAGVLAVALAASLGALGRNDDDE